MANRNEFRMSPPQQVYDAYKEIRNSELILNKTLGEKNIAEFQASLNKSQPSNDEEAKSRSLIQYLYRKNPTNFCRFLVRSRLSHLILWTEAKCIVRHFGLRGIVYVKWNDHDHKYECSVHRNSNNTYNGDEHPSAQRTYQSVGQDFGDELDHRERRVRYNRDGDRYNRRPRGYDRNRSEQHEKPVFPSNTEDNFPTLQVQPKKTVNEPVSQSSEDTQENELESEQGTTNLSASVLGILSESKKGISQHSYSKILQASEEAEL